MKKFDLPKNHEPFSDKYFLRAKEILVKDKLNPVVTAQVFIRKGNCKVYGIDEAVAILTKYGKNLEIYALKEGDNFENGECLMRIKAPIQDIIDLETMYLGVLSAETTLKNGGKDIDLVQIAENMAQIATLVGDRPVSYFGARHWRYDRDAEISHACFAGFASDCSTDAGAKAQDKLGIGTIPHVLEAIYHWKYDLNDAVWYATDAFDKHIHIDVPRIALVDYANKETTDSLYLAEHAGLLQGIRIDTCGENYMQGVTPLIAADTEPYKYWFGKGVCASGVYMVRKALNDAGKEHVKIILSSGFGNPAKVKAFIEAEKLCNMKLFDGLGVGGVFESRMATMDIIKVEDINIHKVGREPKPYDRLKKII